MGPDDSPVSETSSLCDISTGGSGRTTKKKKLALKVRKNLNKSVHPPGDNTKKIIAGLTKNNRELAKRLESREIVIAEQNRQLQYFQEKLNHVVCMNAKVQEAMIKMNNTAAYLNEVVCTLAEVREFARKAVGTEEKDDENTHTMTLRVPVTGLDDVCEENNCRSERIHNNADKMQMSAINEDGLLFEESDSAVGAEKNCGSDLSWMDIGEKDDGDDVVESETASDDVATSPVKSTNNRRKSGLVAVTDITPPSSDQQLNTVSGLETPKTPVLLTTLSKTLFKSSIPKPLSRNKDNSTASSGKGQESTVTACNGTRQDIQASSAPEELHAQTKKRGMSKKPNGSIRLSLANSGPPAPSNESSSSDEVLAKRPKLASAAPGKNRNESEAVPQGNKRRRTFVMQNNSNKPVKADENSSSITESIPCIDLDVKRKSSQRRKTFVMQKENGALADLSDDPKKSLSNIVNRRTTFCIPSKDKSHDVDQNCQSVNESSSPSLTVNEKSPEEAGENTLTSIEAVATDDVSNKDKICGQYIEELDAGAKKLQESSNTTSVLFQNDQITSNQVLDSTVHNVEDMELTEVLRVPVRVLAAQLPIDTNNDGATENVTNELPCSSEVASTNKTTVISSPSVVIVQEATVNDKSCSKSDCGAGDDRNSSIANDVNREAEQPCPEKGPNDSDLCEEKYPQVSSEERSDIHSSNSSTVHAPSSVLRDSIVTTMESDSVKVLSESPAPTGKVRGTLILVKNSPCTKSSFSNSQKNSIPPAGANDPCCSKSLSQEEPSSGLRARKKNQKYKDFFSPLNTHDSDDTDSDFDPRSGVKKQKVAKRQSSLFPSKSTNKGKTPSSSSVKKAENSQGRASVKGRSRVKLNFKNNQPKQQQSSRKSSDILDVYDVRNIDECDSHPVVSSTKKTTKARAKQRGSVSKKAAAKKQSEVDVPVAVTIEDDGNADVTIIEEVKVSGARMTSRQKKMLAKRLSGNALQSEQNKKEKPNTLRKDDEIQPVILEGTESQEASDNSDDDFDTGKTSKSHNNKTESVKKTAQPDAVAASETNVSFRKSSIKSKRTSRGSVGTVSSACSIEDLASLKKNQPVIELADPFEPLKNTSSCDLVKSGFKVQVSSSESSDVLMFKDKLNDTSVIELNLPDKNSPKQRKCQSTETKRNTNKRDSDKENKGSSWPSSDNSSSQKSLPLSSSVAAAEPVIVISTEGSRRSRPVSYKEPKLNSKMRRPC